jgi:hypothetical protein
MIPRFKAPRGASINYLFRTNHRTIFDSGRFSPRVRVESCAVLRDRHLSWTGHCSVPGTRSGLVPGMSYCTQVRSRQWRASRQSNLKVCFIPCDRSENHRRDISRPQRPRAYLDRIEHYRDLSRHRVRLRADVDHVHLLIETAAVGRSKIMQGIQFSYMDGYNRRTVW